MSNLKLTKCHIFASLLIFCIIISETKCEHLELTTANHDTVNIKITSEDSYQGIFTCIPILNSVQKNTLLYINPRPFKFQMAFWHTDIRCCDGNFDILKAMKSSPLHGPFCGSEFLRFSLLKICIAKFQTSDNSQLCIDLQYSSQQLTIGASLKYRNTQPLYIFNRENPQNSEPQNGPRIGLDYIALLYSDQKRV